MGQPAELSTATLLAEISVLDQPTKHCPERSSLSLQVWRSLGDFIEPLRVQSQKLFLHKKEGEAREAAGVESSTRNVACAGGRWTAPETHSR